MGDERRFDIWEELPYIRREDGSRFRVELLYGNVESSHQKLCAALAALFNAQDNKFSDTETMEGIVRIIRSVIADLYVARDNVKDLVYFIEECYRKEEEARKKEGRDTPEFYRGLEEDE